MGIDQTLNHILTVTKAKKQGNGWKGHCPAHKDKSPSLSISQGADARILLNCHANCHIDSICAALNITQADLFPPKQPTQPQGKPRYSLDKVYDYKDESGVLLFQSVRQRLIDPAKFPNEPRKRFRQRAPDGKGSWVWSLQSVRRVLYRLPELLGADPGATVWIPEGEKDVDRLRSLGLIATCNPMGAGKWLDEYSDFLLGRDCVAIEDNDQPGRDHAQEVCQSLFGKAKSLRKLAFTNLPEHGDISDWLDAGGDESQLCQMAEALPEWEPSASTSNGTQSQSAIDATLSRIVTAQTILTTNYPEPKWAVKGVIPEGTTFIAGPPKLGKSIFALNIAVAVSEGGKALSYFDVERGAVLYLALEDGERRIQKRLQKLITQPLSDKLEVVTKWPRINDGGIEAIEEWIRRHGDAMLLIVDTFKMLRPLRAGQINRANAYDLDYEDVSPLTELTTQYHIALNIVTHTRKAIADDPLATVSGSFGLTGAADGVLILARQRNQRTATLTVIGRDVEEQELALEFKPDNFLWSALGKSSDVKRSNERQEILDVLKDSEEPLAPGNIATVLDRSARAITALLWKMKGAGEVKSFGRKYHLPDYAPRMKQNAKNKRQPVVSSSPASSRKKPKKTNNINDINVDVFAVDVSKPHEGNGLDANINDINTSTHGGGDDDKGGMCKSVDVVDIGQQTLHTEIVTDINGKNINVDVVDVIGDQNTGRN